jgi:hypothetical protein
MDECGARLGAAQLARLARPQGVLGLYRTRLPGLDVPAYHTGTPARYITRLPADSARAAGCVSYRTVWQHDPTHRGVCYRHAVALHWSAMNLPIPA